MWLFFCYTVQLITINLCTKFQSPKSSSCWEIFDGKKSLQTNRQTNQTNIITEKAKTIYPLYTSYRGYNDAFPNILVHHITGFILIWENRIPRLFPHYSRTLYFIFQGLNFFLILYKKMRKFALFSLKGRNKKAHLISLILTLVIKTGTTTQIE